MSKYTGIDVSKATLDVAYLNKQQKWVHQQVSNNVKGFKAIIKMTATDGVIVMEASGPYYMQLAMFLHKHGRAAAVVNPLKVRRYSQMKMQRAKTDRKDAQTIADFAEIDKPKLWQPNDQVINDLQQIITALDSINKQIIMNKNQLEAFKSSGSIERQVRKSLKHAINSLEHNKVALNKQLDKLTQEQYSETMELLTSIPGIGPKGATMLTIITNNFQKFSHYKQVIAYVGFSPRIFESGTSVRGKGHICKMGKSQVRKILYMCSWSAKFKNKACREMYDRLKAKGKPERVIKIAIANKLIKQAFAVATNKTVYSENYQSNICF